MFSAGGAVTSRIDYGPFGDQIGTSTMSSKVYAQLFRDGEAGLDHAGARMYQARVGRFNAPDPVYASLFQPQAWNRYSYALNTPLGFVDPTGLTAENCTTTEQWVVTNQETNDGYLAVNTHCTIQTNNDGGGGGWFDPTWWSLWGWLAGPLEAGTVYQPDFINAPIQETGGGPSGAGEASSGCRISILCEDGGPIEVSMAGVPSPGAAGAAIVALGARGEQLVRNVFDIGKKRPFAINGRFRITDGSLKTVVTEIKNVSYLSNTLQLRDLAAHALQNGQRLDLWIRTNTVLSGPVQQAATNSNGMIRIIPVLPPR